MGGWGWVSPPGDPVLPRIDDLRPVRAFKATRSASIGAVDTKGRPESPKKNAASNQHAQLMEASGSGAMQRHRNRPTHMQAGVLGFPSSPGEITHKRTDTGDHRLDATRHEALPLSVDVAHRLIGFCRRSCPQTASVCPPRLRGQPPTQCIDNADGPYLTRRARNGAQVMREARADTSTEFRVVK